MYGGYANGAANGYATGAANSYGQQQAAYAGQAPQSYQQPAQPTPPAPPAMPGLPAGWSPARCPTTGNTYFYEHATGKVSWTPPKQPEVVVAASAQPLPPSTQVPQNYEGASAQTLPEEAQDAWDAVQAHIAASRLGKPPPQFTSMPQTTQKKRGGDLSSLKKDLESPPDVLRWRQERDITVAGGCDSCFPRFEDAPLLPALYTSLKAAGFSTPSPIQGQAWPLPVWKSTRASGAPDNSSPSHFSAMTRPCWPRREMSNRHRHAIELASRRWRGGRRDDSARRRRKFDFHAGAHRLGS